MRNGKKRENPAGTGGRRYDAGRVRSERRRLSALASRGSRSGGAPSWRHRRGNSVKRWPDRHRGATIKMPAGSEAKDEGYPPSRRKVPGIGGTPSVRRRRGNSLKRWPDRHRGATIW